MSETEAKSEGKFKEGTTLTRTDSKGRVLTLRQLTLREEMDLISVAGGADAMNARWMLYATMVACVRNIDEVPQPFPRKRAVLNDRIALVDSEGVAVVAAVLAAEAPPPKSEDEDDDEEGGAIDPETATAKN